MSKRGYYGIAFFEPKFIENIGTIIRSANCFQADFIAIIGGRYQKTAMDTMKTHKHVPIYEYRDMNDFIDHIPIECDVVGVEVGGDSINEFKHPERAIYLLGGEDRTLPEMFGKNITIDTTHCLNMAVAASIIMYDRSIKK